MKTSIVWFKTDLRLHDNEALVKAIEQSEVIIPVYCIDNSHYSTTEFGFKKTGSFRAEFLLESLIDLDKSLREIGSGLLLVRGNPAEEISKVANKYKASKVYAKREVGFEEKQLENLVEKELWKINCTLEKYSTSTLYHALDLPFSIKDIPDVFTTFRKKVEKESSIRSIFDKPISIKSPEIPPIEMPRIEQLGLEHKQMDARAAFKFKGGETEAIKRINEYFFESQSLANYKETRNGLIGADYSSKLSPWLALGCVSPRMIYNEIKKFEQIYSANESTYWLEFELLWRDYFRFIMKKHQNKFFQIGGIKSNQNNLNEHNIELFNKWANAQTGIDFIDANMTELKLTGYMSNRGRQNVASYFCNDLKLDWRYGASYFEEQLIDYDVCSNWGNWAYIAGVGNDPRKDRYFNIDKQANDYDKDKSYRKLWLRN